MISPTCVDSILSDLHCLREDRRLTARVMNQIHILEYELEPLNLYLFCLAKWNDAENFLNKLLGFFSSICCGMNHFGFRKEPLIEATLKKAEEKLSETGFQALADGEFEDWNTLVSDLLEISQLCKPEIKEDCLYFLDSSFKGVFSDDDLKRFMGNVFRSLHKLLAIKSNMNLHVKVKIESLTEKLDLFNEVFDFTSTWCCSREALEDFKIHSESWAWKAAWLSLRCWTLDEPDEKMAPTLNAILSDILQNINPSTAQVTRIYLAVLKASKPVMNDGSEMILSQGRMVSKFAQFLLENLQVDLQNDGIQMLHSGLQFLIAFLMYPPKEEKYTEEVQLILTQAEVFINGAAFLISSLSADQFNEGIAEERNRLLHDFVRKVNVIKAEVRKLYAHSLLHASSDFNFPTVNIRGLIESIIENCKEISGPFFRRDVMTLQEDLLSFVHFLKLSNLNKFQNDDKEPKDLWTQIVNVAYRVEITMNSFIYMPNPIWYDMVCLSYATEQMKLVRGEIKMIEDHYMHNTVAFSVESYSSSSISLQARIPEMEEVVVGFDKKVEDVLDRLLGGSTKLDIISIVGMPGVGKTTLAKKVYDEPSIRNHFNQTAWCIVSQAYDSQRLLLDILTGLGALNSSFSKLDEERLAEILHKRLKGQKYLIVMDDIWDIGAWDSLKMSFPDDKNGSRILFTSRTYNVVLEAKSDCIPYPLGPLSRENSWKLLEKKLFYKDKCPRNFVDVGKQIVTNCKGLPLAIVLIAGVLMEKIENLDWWREIRDSLGSLIVKQGIMDPLELSYKHLPDFLKPCFLYFGLLQEDQEISAQKLTQLWLAEGFVPKHDKKSFEVVAKEYLIDLVARSLVIVSKRSSTGGIKACCIHDLLHDFCLVKGEQEKFLKVVNPNASGRTFAWESIFNHYRVCIQGPEREISLSGIPSAQYVHSLVSFYSSYLYELRKDFLINLKFLRVLALENIFLQLFPKEVKSLVFLRYLGIFCESLCCGEICRLKSLETLHLPEIFYKYLHLTGMKKLRHVRTGFVYISCHFSKMENIQTFSTPCFDNREEAESFLRRIPTVKKLKCRCDEIPKFDFLSFLESLDMAFTEKGSHKCEFYFPSTLKKLTLRKFKLAWTDLSALGKLPNLQVLKLMVNSVDRKTWNVEDVEFLKLKFLKLQSVNIKKWNVSDDTFPCLECLVLQDCPELKVLPSAFGNIPTLNLIQVWHCNPTVKRSAMQIKEDQLELGNVDLKVLV